VIATVKTLLIVAYFQHLRWENRSLTYVMSLALALTMLSDGRRDVLHLVDRSPASRPSRVRFRFRHGPSLLRDSFPPVCFFVAARG